MGTRSVVAAQFGDEIKGVYVHWNGYPEGVGKALVEIISRDGREKAVETILGEPTGWSMLGSEITDDVGRDPRRFSTVTGYGVQYVPEKEGGDGGTEYRKPGDGGEEYFYVIGQDGTVQWCPGDFDAGKLKTLEPVKA